MHKKSLDLKLRFRYLFFIMSGISGIFCLEKNKGVDIRLLREMNNLLTHRGPDGEGYFLSGQAIEDAALFAGEDSSAGFKSANPSLDKAFPARLGFGFRQMLVHENQKPDVQPFYDPQAKLCIVMDGSIFNRMELKKELEKLGFTLEGDSDAELVLRAFQAWGEECLKRLNGFWALAIWDEAKNRLFCARDRFGVRPLYFCIHAGILYFGSEIKPLLLSPVNKTLNRPMILRWMKIPSLSVYGGQTFWKCVHALEPGQSLWVRKGHLSLCQWYRLDPAKFGTSRLSFTAATQTWRELLTQAVKRQTPLDANIGIGLSGGLDSSAIACLAGKHCAEPPQAFSAYFEDLPQLDERRWIAEVASACGCASHLVSPNAFEALDWFGEATWHSETPLNSGFAAQFAVTRLAASQGTKILLGGQGSDELSAGYAHALYRWLADLLLSRDPALGKEVAAFMSRQSFPKNMMGLAKSLLTTALNEKRLYDLEFRFLRFDPFNPEFHRQTKLSLGSPILSRFISPKGKKLDVFLHNGIFTTSLPGLLHSEDRVAMAASLENRLPFLDHELVEFAFSLPNDFKIQNARGKRVHREAVRDLVPPSIYTRQDKAVFGSPFAQLWLRRELKDAVNDLFYSQEFRRRGIWNLPQIHTQWQNFLSGQASQAETIFGVFALENWFRRFEPWLDLDIQC